MIPRVEFQYETIEPNVLGVDVKAIYSEKQNKFKFNSMYYDFRNCISSPIATLL